MAERARGQIVRQPLDEGRAAPRIDEARRAGFLLQDQLRVAGDARRMVGRQRQRLVEGIGVQRLGAALRRRHRLDHGAHDVVVGILRGQRPAGGLAMGAQRQRALVLRRKILLDQGCPQQPAGPQLGDLHEEVHAGVPEEGKARREAVDVEPGGDAGTRIFDAVGDGVGELQVGRRAGLLHVIAGDRDRVEFRHVPRRVADDVGDDPHRRLWRVDVGVADHELLQDVVLDGPGRDPFRATPCSSPPRCRAP